MYNIGDANLVSVMQTMKLSRVRARGKEGGNGKERLVVAVAESKNGFWVWGIKFNHTHTIARATHTVRAQEIPRVGITDALNAQFIKFNLY